MKNPRLAFLKVKVCSLAEETRIIRQQKALAKRRNKRRSDPDKVLVMNGLQAHKIQKVRPEARAAHVAYCLLRGRTIDEIEPTRKSDPDWRRVGRLMERYGDGSIPVPIAA